MFNDVLLEAFMKEFYGYGNYRAPYWFIGMEEGGGNSFEEIQQRLVVWDRRGRQELEDVAAYHLETGINHHFVEKPPVQKTWRRLIELVLKAEGKTGTIEEVRTYQRDQWARSEGKECLLELFPLPSPSTKNWLYGEYSKLSYLKTRRVYHDYLAEVRSLHIKQRIDEFQPKIVIFYSLNYVDWWKKIAAIDFIPIAIDRFLFYSGRRGQTNFVITAHPTAFGITNEYFHRVNLHILER